MVCNADLLFIDVYAQWPGSVHDARVLRKSALFASFERPPRPVEGVLLGDSGYMLREWLFTPIRNPAYRKEERFNFAHMSTRSAVERALGMYINCGIRTVIKKKVHQTHLFMGL